MIRIDWATQVGEIVYKVTALLQNYRLSIFHITTLCVCNGLYFPLPSSQVRYPTPHSQLPHLKFPFFSFSSPIICCSSECEMVQSFASEKHVYSTKVSWIEAWSAYSLRVHKCFHFHFLLLFRPLFSWLSYFSGGYDITEK